MIYDPFYHTNLSDQIPPHFLQLLMDFMGRQVQIPGNLRLFVIGQPDVDLAQVPIDNPLAGTVVGPVVEVVPARQVGQQLAQVHFQVGEEIHVLAALKRTQGVDAAVNGRVQDDLLARGGHESSLYGSDYLAHVEAADLLHLEGRAIEIPVLPLEFVGVGIVLEIILGV